MSTKSRSEPLGLSRPDLVKLASAGLGAIGLANVSSSPAPPLYAADWDEN